MKHNKKIISSLFLTATLVFGLSFSSATQAQRKNLEEPVETTENRAQIWAKETGAIAGGANFCKFDPELIESYITRAQAKIASEAHSEVELVVARITFTNTLNTSSINEPVEGCEDFNSLFERESVRLD